jgi:dihydroorotate dehydrogenase
MAPWIDPEHLKGGMVVCHQLMDYFAQPGNPTPEYARVFHVALNVMVAFRRQQSAEVRRRTNEMRQQAMVRSMIAAKHEAKREERRQYEINLRAADSVSIFEDEDKPLPE